MTSHLTSWVVDLILKKVRLLVGSRSRTTDLACRVRLDTSSSYWAAVVLSTCTALHWPVALYYYRGLDGDALRRVEHDPHHALAVLDPPDRLLHLPAQLVARLVLLSASLHPCENN